MMGAVGWFANKREPLLPLYVVVNGGYRAASASVQRYTTVRSLGGTALTRGPPAALPIGPCQPHLAFLSCKKSFPDDLIVKLKEQGLALSAVSQRFTEEFLNIGRVSEHRQMHRNSVGAILYQVKNETIKHRQPVEEMSPRLRPQSLYHCCIRATWLPGYWVFSMT